MGVFEIILLIFGCNCDACYFSAGYYCYYSLGERRKTRRAFGAEKLSAARKKCAIFLRKWGLNCVSIYF